MAKAAKKVVKAVEPEVDEVEVEVDADAEVASADEVEVVVPAEVATSEPREVTLEDINRAHREHDMKLRNLESKLTEVLAKVREELLAAYERGVDVSQLEFEFVQKAA